MVITKQELFGQIDFRTISQNPDFKEDSVREVLILPILKHLGYEQQNIVRSKTLTHPFLKVGSNKKREIKLIPDYLLKVEENYAWVLDAKAPNQRVNDSDHIEQVYSYASHPEIRSTYFALCNGMEFSLYRRESTNTPILLFSLDEIEHYWVQLNIFLSPNSFQVGKNFTYNTTTLEQINDELIIKGLELGFLDLLKKEYSDLTPILLGSFDYSEETELFTIRKNAKFMTHVDVKLRIRYYLMSYLRRMERENKSSTFDEIILEILPLLRNGTTPENQTVLSVLEDIAERVGLDSWRMKQERQRSLFD